MEDIELLDILEKYEQKRREIDNYYREQNEIIKKQLIKSLSQKEQIKERELENLRNIKKIYEMNDIEGMNKISEIIKEKKASFLENIIEQKENMLLKEEADSEGNDEIENGKKTENLKKMKKIEKEDKKRERDNQSMTSKKRNKKTINE